MTLRRHRPRDHRTFLCLRGCVFTVLAVCLPFEQASASAHLWGSCCHTRGHAALSSCHSRAIQEQACRRPHVHAAAVQVVVVQPGEGLLPWAIAAAVGRSAVTGQGVVGSDAPRVPATPVPRIIQPLLSYSRGPPPPDEEVSYALEVGAAKKSQPGKENSKEEPSAPGTPRATTERGRGARLQGQGASSI